MRTFSFCLENGEEHDKEKREEKRQNSFAMCHVINDYHIIDLIVFRLFLYSCFVKIE